MLYKFKSKAASDLIMLEPNGRRVLQIIGKDPGAQGIILPGQMPAAIAALEAEIAREQARLKAAAEEAGGADEEDKPGAEVQVALRQRAQPFIEMLKRCEKAGAEIVWGV